ncbi:hypothetical protein Tsp_09830 [Trichinella spiralis]|uniref:hypothetical protein n=1 Tax=Trichinella spiralis TaxID=6334 RepID=UPI0001EFD9FD|nr:hypothetical protein Tsp_09830 [Trichinella spiralis]
MHRAVDIAFFDVSFGLSFVDKLKLLVPHSRFLRQIIDFSTSYHSWKWTLNPDNEFEQAKHSIKNRRRGILCIIFTSDNSELRVVSNRCGGLSLVFEGRAYKLKHTRKQKKYCVAVPKNFSAIRYKRFRTEQMYSTEISILQQQANLNFITIYTMGKMGNTWITWKKSISKVVDTVPRQPTNRYVEKMD